MKRIKIAAIAAVALFGAIGISPAMADDFDHGARFQRQDRFDRHDHDLIVWKGSVDDVVEVYIRGDQVWTNICSGKAVRGEAVRVNSALPRDDVRVRLDDVRGRGRVYVFQQPTRDNRYTVGIRIEDRDPARGDYRLAVDW